MTGKVGHEAQTTLCTATGDITLAKILTHLGLEGERGGLGYRELLDASQATAVFSSADVRRTVTVLTDLGRKGALGPTAVIVSNDITYGMFRMLGILLEDVCEFQVFRTTEREEAEKWLETATIVAGSHNDKLNDA